MGQGNRTPEIGQLHEQIILSPLSLSQALSQWGQLKKWARYEQDLRKKKLKIGEGTERRACKHCF